MPKYNPEPNLEDKLRALKIKLDRALQQQTKVGAEDVLAEAEKRMKELEGMLARIEIKEEFPQKTNHLEVMESYGKKINAVDLEQRLRNVDSHFVLPKGDYTVNFDITVKLGGTLEIQPGTRIYFSSKGGIYCANGVLKVIGTPEERIVFTASSAVWKNIVIKGDGQKSSDSVLQYCDISRGRGRKRQRIIFQIKTKTYGGGLAIYNSSPLIENCRIFGCEAYCGGAAYLSDSKAVLRNNEMCDNTATFMGGAVAIYKGEPLIETNKLNRNSGCYGGAAYLSDSNAMLIDNEICENSVDNIQEKEGEHRIAKGVLRIKRGFPTLKSNTIKDN